MNRSHSHELLTKSDILKQYRIPKNMLDEAILNGELRSIDGPIEVVRASSDDGKQSWTYALPRPRFYIPRHTVEAWIDRKVGAA